MSSPSARPASTRSGTVHIVDTSIQVWEVEVHDSIRTVLAACVALLRRRGWSVCLDPRIARDYPTLSRDHWYASHTSGLEVLLQLCGRHLKIEFFQNVANVSNQNGGQYDFGKFARMPRAMQIRCVVELAAMVRRLLRFGYAFGHACDLREPLLMSTLKIVTGRSVSERSPLEQFNIAWSFSRSPVADRFDRDETGWPSEKELRSWAHTDRDGVVLRNGDWRYVRVDGRVRHVQAFGGINGMWQAWSNGVQVGWGVGATEFSSRFPEDEPRRLVPGQTARLEKELEKATKAKDWRRSAAIAGVLDRISKVPSC